MKILITEEQSKMLINHIISEEENITDKTKNEKFQNEKLKINSVKSISNKGKKTN